MLLPQHFAFCSCKFICFPFKISHSAHAPLTPLLLPQHFTVPSARAPSSFICFSLMYLYPASLQLSYSFFLLLSVTLHVIFCTCFLLVSPLSLLSFCISVIRIDSALCHRHLIQGPAGCMTFKTISSETGSKQRRRKTSLSLPLGGLTNIN